MVKSLRSPVPGEKKYHLGYPSGRKGGSAGGWGPPVPGGGALAIGGSFLAILGAGCIAGAAADAADFCGGALGDAAVNKGGGALNGIPDLAIGWSAASAGSVGGSGFGEPTMLLGVGGGLGFGGRQRRCSRRRRNLRQLWCLFVRSHSCLVLGLRLDELPNCISDHLCDATRTWSCFRLGRSFALGLR